MNRSLSTPGRRAFTLVELLVVLAILTVLIALSASAAVRFISTGSNRVTVSTLQLVGRMLKTQWNSIADKATREAIPPLAQGAVDGLAAGDALVSQRARVLYVKLRLKSAFPMNFNEVYVPYTAAFAMPEYQTYLNKLGYAAGNPAAWPAENFQNAVCLLMILEVGPGGSGANNSELTGLSKTLATNGANQVRGLIDGYGFPLIFSRTPMAFAGFNTNTPLDSADPSRYLAANDWPAANRNSARTALGFQIQGQATVPLDIPFTRQVKPLVASAGLDNIFGLDPRTFAGARGTPPEEDNRYTDF